LSHVSDAVRPLLSLRDAYLVVTPRRIEWPMTGPYFRNMLGGCVRPHVNDRPSKLGKLLSSLSDGRLVHLDQEITPSSVPSTSKSESFDGSFQLVFRGVVDDYQL
jgi:hypothetical protein